MHGGAAGSRRCQERCRDTEQSAECLNRVTATWPPLPAACPPPSPCHFSVTFSRSVDRGTVNLDLPITPRLPVGSVSFSQSVDRWGQRVLISPSPPSPSRSSVIGLHRNRCLWTPQGQRVLVSCERHVFPSALCLGSQGQRVLISVVPAVCSFQYRPTYVTGQNQTSGSFEVMTFNSPRRTRQR